MFNGVTREQVKVKLPAGFDPKRNGAALIAKVKEVYGPEAQVNAISLREGVAFVSFQSTMTEVEEVDSNGARAIEVRLGEKLRKPGDGPRAAAIYENQHPGYYLARFDPFLGKAIMLQMTDDEVRCRGAIANVLGVQPWEVMVVARRGGGFDLQLPNRYTPSKHDEKLTEVAEEIVGTPGWYHRIDARTLRGAIIPSDPPTFPGSIPYPFKAKLPKFSLHGNDWSRVPIGMKLPKPGQKKGDLFYLDMLVGAHSQLVGTSGSGKSVTINAYLAGMLARGAELVIVDLPSKSVDFQWCKKYVREGGWGCDSLAGAVAALAMVMEEGSRRADILKKHGVTKWTELPDSYSESFRPILVVADELTGLFFPEEEPKGLPKDHPLRLEAQDINLQKQVLKKYIKRIAAELRFVGVSLFISSQVASVNTGIDPSLRTNLHHKIILGPKATDNNRRLVLMDADGSPRVPGHVIADEDAAKGTGVAEPEGQAPTVFKSFYASVGEYETWLESLGVTHSKNPAPTAKQIAKYTPSLQDSMEQVPARSTSKGERAPSGKPAAQVAAEMGDTVGMAMHSGELGTGFEKANAVRNLAAGGGKTRREKEEERADMAAGGDVTVTQMVKCESCGGFVNPLTGACRCSA